MSLDLERTYSNAPSEIELNTRAQARRAEHRSKKEARRQKARRLMQKTGFTALALFGAGSVGETIHYLSNEDSLRQRAQTYEGAYKIPSTNEPHRALFVDTKEKLTLSNGNTLVLNLGTVAQMANYIHAKNPEIDESEATDLIEAENYQDQKDVGLREDEIDPTLLRPYAEVRLPLEYNVGKLVKAAKDESNHK
jgi:hypothetical protein